MVLLMLPVSTGNWLPVLSHMVQILVCLAARCSLQDHVVYKVPFSFTVGSPSCSPLVALIQLVGPWLVFHVVLALLRFAQ